MAPDNRSPYVWLNLVYVLLLVAGVVLIVLGSTGFSARPELGLLLIGLGAGATALCPGAHAGPEAMAQARQVFDLVGSTVEVSEAQMDAVTGLSGSGPAYVYTVIEALADGGVKAGLPKDVAMQLAAQTVAGAARMILDGQGHPAQLRDQVTSPGGTTIAGLAALEAGGLRHALMSAVVAAADRAAELGDPDR